MIHLINHKKKDRLKTWNTCTTFFLFWFIYIHTHVINLNQKVRKYTNLYMINTRTVFLRNKALFLATASIILSQSRRMQNLLLHSHEQKSFKMNGRQCTSKSIFHKRTSRNGLWDLVVDSYFKLFVSITYWLICTQFSWHGLLFPHSLYQKKNLP